MSHQPLTNEILLQQMRWRYATKKFDPTRKISPEDWRTLEEALILTPSSFGMQPWKFIVITDQATKEKLVPVSWGQRQLADASHVVVFAIKKSIGVKELEHYLARIVEVRGVTLESLKVLRDMITSNVLESPHTATEWAHRQIYIALGNFMTCAALLGIDACPLEGIEPAKYDQILGLSHRGLATSVAAAAGYRAADDKYATLAKVRFKSEEVIERI